MWQLFQNIALENRFDKSSISAIVCEMEHGQQENASVDNTVRFINISVNIKAVSEIFNRQQAYTCMLGHKLHNSEFPFDNKY